MPDQSLPDVTLSSAEATGMSTEQLLSLACSLLQRQQYGKVINLCRGLLEASPDQIDALNLLAVAMVHDQGPCEEVITLLRRVVDLEPRHLDAWDNLGNVCKLRGQPDEAIRAYRKVIALDKNRASVHNNLGLAYIEKQALANANRSFREAIRLQPDLVQAHFNLGRLLCHQRQYTHAMKAFQTVLRLKPDYFPVYRPYGMLLYSQQRTEEAIALYRHWLDTCPDDPVAQHMLAACGGDDVPARASDDYVRVLFDQHAASFDDNLTKLDYRAPQLIAQQVKALERQSLVVLDAGCGTGLVGPLITDSCARLVGIDLSPGMLQKAQQRNVYDVLEKAELTRYLIDTPAQWDLVLSADTLCYFGDLTVFAGAAYAALCKEGVLMFTVEHDAALADRPGYRLGSSGRYAHSDAYVNAVLTQAGFTVAPFQKVVLRKENGKGVMGLVVVAWRV